MGLANSLAPRFSRQGREKCLLLKSHAETEEDQEHQPPELFVSDYEPPWARSTILKEEDKQSRDKRAVAGTEQGLVTDTSEGRLRLMAEARGACRSIQRNGEHMLGSEGSGPAGGGSPLASLALPNKLAHLTAVPRRDKWPPAHSGRRLYFGSPRRWTLIQAMPFPHPSTAPPLDYPLPITTRSPAARI
jgi:hypothetical protein